MDVPEHDAPQHDAPQHFADDWWVDDQAGPVVRPYVLTQGWAQPIGLVSMVRAVPGEVPPAVPGLDPEHLDVVRLCRGSHISVAEIAAQVSLPLGTVRALLGDLVAQGLVQVQEVPALAFPSDALEAVLDGLRTL